MVEVSLAIRAPDGVRRVPLTNGRVTVGRGGAADVRVNDSSLSRVHASIHCEGERVWVLDERSTNGTSVNGRSVPTAGLPLADGDEITIGDGTTITVGITRKKAARAGARPDGGLPRAPLIATLVLVAVIGAAFGSHAVGVGSEGMGTAHERPEPGGGVRAPMEAGAPFAGIGPSDGGADARGAFQSGSSDAAIPFSEDAPEGNAGPALPPATHPGKLYQEMSEQEQVDFIDREARRVSRMIGTRSYAFTDEVLAIIKKYLDAYAGRARSSSRRTWGEGLPSLYGRASRYAPLINKAFRARGLSPVIGLYIVMIETEYHECLTSPVGAKGMFQFMPATALAYGVDPSERCDVERMAPVCARYMADLIAEFGSDSLSVALAIASYNRGEGGIRTDLHKVLDSENRERSFWTLVENEDKLPPGFQNENIKYVPKFFAAAIIGENPRSFGLELRPLSTYTD